MKKAKILTVGDSSILIEFGKEISPAINARIATMVKLLKVQQIEGIIDMIPSFCALLINYDSRVISYAQLKVRLEAVLKLDAESESVATSVFDIPVCYGGKYGPDMANLVEHSGLSEKEIIKIHSGSDYLIYMLGFLPGFPYLGGLDERIHIPRLASPRIKIPAGSVGIGGAQTGIYPLDSPGGWQLLGQTPVKTYDPERETPILFEAGDYIRFVPVSEKEFLEIEKQVKANEYQCVVRKMEV